MVKASGAATVWWTGWGRPNVPVRDHGIGSPFSGEGPPLLSHAGARGKWFKSRKPMPASSTARHESVSVTSRPATNAGGKASNAARKLLDAGHLEHIETNKETDPAYKRGSRPKTYITTS